MVLVARLHIFIIFYMFEKGGPEWTALRPFVMSYIAVVDAQTQKAAQEKEENSRFFPSLFASSPLSDSLQNVWETREFLRRVGLSQSCLNWYLLQGVG